jgi:tetratricopeptide (TPR) repeat protein
MEPQTPTEQGFAALRGGDPATAMELFREAIEAEPNELQAHRGMVQAARVLRIWAEVVSALEKVTTLSTDRRDLVDGHLALARVHDDETGNTDATRRHLEAALMVDPDQWWPYLALAELDLRVRNWARAIAHADHGLEFCPHDATERPYLLVLKALAMQKVSVSVGPMSTFFRGLRNEPAEIDPSEQAMRQAGELLPVIAERPARDWLSKPDETAAWVRAKMPKAPLPTWWF